MSVTSTKITKDLTGAVMQTLRGLADRRVLVGIPADKNARKDRPIGNAALGYLHENGSPAQNIPARPFLMPGMKAASKECADILKKAAQQGLGHEAGAMEKGLNAAGLHAQATVKQTLKDGEGFAPLKPSTLAARTRKGFKGAKPLVRAGQLMNSITYVVRDR